MLAAVVWDSDGGWVRYTDHQAEMERLTSTRDAAQAEVERLTVERDTAYISIESLRNALAEQDHELDIAREDVLRLTAERDEAQAEVEQLWRDLTAADGTIDRLRTELAQQDHDLQTAREDVLRLTSEHDAAQAEVERLTAERDMARAEVRRLIAERDQPESRPKGREVGRFGLDGHYLAAMEPTRLIDEDIWREAFMTLLPSYPWEKAAAHADSALAEYRKRWPR
jgi:peptidoglycan hydrolase CwlO-like protein